MYLISFSNQSLQRTEDSVMGSNSDQDVLERINLMIHDLAEELSQVFNQRKMALMRETKEKTDVEKKGCC